jgi:DNA topoisomerase-1
MTNYITRKKSGKTFKYYLNDEIVTDESIIDRINKLVIPPAWRQVEISKAKSAKIQARGYDAAGRLQSIYNPAYRLKQDKLKFDRILRFAEQLPALRRQVEKDLARKKLGKDKVLACVVKLIDQAFFRVGNDRYAKEHQTYGVTTLRSKHAKITSNQVTFDFVGKSGKEHVKTISDPKLARIIKQLDELPGHEIFRYQDADGVMHDLHAHDVNEYIKQHMGEEFTAKDFRTWGGTLLASSAVIKSELDDTASETARKRAVAKIVKRVAKRLGNTPSVARSSYIDPRVLAAVEKRSNLPEIRESIALMEPIKYLTVDEQSVLKLLQSK